MNKRLLLARSHFRKNRGTSIGLLCLMILTALLFSASLLILTDAYPLAEREAERLDSGDGFFRITSNLEGVDEDVIEELLKDDTTRHYTYKCLNYISTVPFGTGKMSANIQYCDADTAFHKEMANSEIVTEDTSITSDYVYLPYHFYSAGGFNIGDTFSVEVQDRTYDLKVRGFLTTSYFGCNNSGSYEIVVDDETYEEMNSVEGKSDCYITVFELKDGVKLSSFVIRFGNDIISRAPGAVVAAQSLEVNIRNKTFISQIFVISFMVVTVIILLVVLMMLVNCIRNYIRESMRILGALKAIGYTSRDIKISLHILFCSLAVTGSLLGILAAYLTMPLFANIAVSQMGIPYKASFVFFPMLLVLLAIVLFTFIVTECSLDKVRKIDPITALRGGTEAHSFRKNRVRLDRSSLGINLALALKTTFYNMKQNIVTFIVVGAMVFLCTIGVLLYENFNVHPKIDMLTFELCDGIVAFDSETKEEGREYLENSAGAVNIRDIIQVDVCYGDEDKLTTYIMGDVSAMNNKNVCYKGRLPQYDNEVAISGQFCKDYGFSVGDTIELTYGEDSSLYLITGLVQTTNNGGREAVMSVDAAERIMDMETAPGYYYFDTEESSIEAVEAVFDKCTDEYGEHVISTMNFFEVVEGSMTTFRFASAAMLGLMCVVSALVILLTLYLLVKALIVNKQKDYGIFKAIGYSSRNLRFQTAMSFMPPIILSVLVFSVLSYVYANPVMNIVMGSFGIIKSDFNIPVTGVLLIGVFLIVISFLIALLQTGRIKKLEAYNLLLAE